MEIVVSFNQLLNSLVYVTLPENSVMVFIFATLKT